MKFTYGERLRGSGLNVQGLGVRGQEKKKEGEKGRNGEAGVGRR